MERKKRWEPVVKAGSVVLWLVLWHVAASLANRSLLLKIPLPIQTAAALCRMAVTPEFLKAVCSSVLRICLGFLCAFAVGTLWAVANDRSRTFELLTAPAHRLIKTVPVAALVVVAWLWLPSRVLPSLMGCLMVLPVIRSHAEAGLAAVDPGLTEMASSFGKSKAFILFHVKLPLVSPHLRTGCLTGFGIAWKAGVAAEVIASPVGSLGSLLSGAKTSVDYEGVFAVTLAVILLSVLLEGALRLVWRGRKI